MNLSYRNIACRRFSGRACILLPRLVGRASTRSPSSGRSCVDLQRDTEGTRSCLQRNSLKRLVNVDLARLLEGAIDATGNDDGDDVLWQLREALPLRVETIADIADQVEQWQDQLVKLSSPLTSGLVTRFCAATYLLRIAIINRSSNGLDGRAARLRCGHV